MTNALACNDHPSNNTMASVESLAQCLQSTLVPDPATRKAAERALEDMQIQQGFASVPLALVQAPQADRASRQGEHTITVFTSISFKSNH